MENKSHALIAGLFILALGTALALAVLWFDRDTRERLPYQLTTKSSVSGLTMQSAVRYRGLGVGKVEKIAFDPQVPGQILIDISVEKTAPITKSTFATLAYQGVTGLAYIQLDDDGKSTDLMPTSEEHIARIEVRPGLFDKLAGNGEGLMLEVTEIAHNVNALLAPKNQEKLLHTLGSLDLAATNLAQIGPHLAPTLQKLPSVLSTAQKTMLTVDQLAQDYDGLANRLMGHGGVVEDIHDSLTSFNQALVGVNAMTNQIDMTLTHLSNTSDVIQNETLPHLNLLIEDAAEATRGMGSFTTRLNENPQRLIFGDSPVPPGPGEKGFKEVKP